MSLGILLWFEFGLDIDHLLNAEHIELEELPQHSASLTRNHLPQKYPQPSAPQRFPLRDLLPERQVLLRDDGLCDVLDQCLVASPDETGAQARETLDVLHLLH